MNDLPKADRFVLLNDQPTGQSDDHDALGMVEAVAGLVSLIIESRDSAPFTLGIDASWGMGKSSVMLQLQAALDMQAGVVTSWFNAWTADNNDALAALIKSALMSVDENVLRRALRRVARHRNFLAGLRVLLIVVASFLHLARTVDQLWDVLSVDASGRNAIRGDLQQIFGTWAAKTTQTPAGRLLVVFVDDLDRCSSEVVLAVCEAVKLYLAVPGIVFVLGCDQAILAQAALDSRRVSQVAASLDYLEKIVQITYRKPAADEKQINQLIGYYAELSGTAKLFSESAKQVVVQGTGRNPRRIKRLINSFILEYRLDPGWADFGAEALINVILLQHFYPDFYRELAQPEGLDVAHEFLEYYNLRSRLQVGDMATSSDVEFFKAHGASPPLSNSMPSAEDVGRLEQQLPVSFPSLARRPEFMQLLANLCDHNDFEQLMNRLQSRALTEISTFVEAHHGTERPPKSSDSQILDSDQLNILWISQNTGDTPAGVMAALQGYPEERSIVVHAATGLADARRYLKDAKQDVIILSINSGQRGADTDAISVLQNLRQTTQFSGPAVFFASRVTPERVKRVTSVNAKITSSRDDLVAFLEEIARGRRAKHLPD